MEREPGDPPPGICKSCKRNKVYKGLTRLCYSCWKGGRGGRTDGDHIYFDASGICSKEQEKEEEEQK